MSQKLLGRSSRKTSNIMREPYDVDTMVLCADKDGLYYAAKIIAVHKVANDYLYTIHYQGWNRLYDEKVLHSDAAIRFREYSKENLKLSQEEFERKNPVVSRKRGRNVERKGSLRKAPNSDLKPSVFERSRSTTPSTLPEKDSIEAISTNQIAQKAVNDAAKEAETDVDKKTKKEDLQFALFKIQRLLVKSLPKKLRIILDNDERLIETMSVLPRFPARSSVSKIIKEFADYIRQLDKKIDGGGRISMVQKNMKFNLQNWKGVIASLDELIIAIKNFFDIRIYDDLLYTIEKFHYHELVYGKTQVMVPLKLKSFHDISQLSESDLRPSSCYGFVHLVRLLVLFTEFIPNFACDRYSTDILETFKSLFFGFLDEELGKYYNPETDYQNNVDVQNRRKVQAFR